MQIVEKLITSLSDEEKDLKVVDVRLGLGYTAVKVADGGVGTALTMGKEGARGCQVFRGKWPLKGSRAEVIVNLLGEGNLLLRSLGLACFNALRNRKENSDGMRPGDVLQAVPFAKGATDQVVMIGSFGPLMGPLRKRCAELKVFDRSRNAQVGSPTAPEALEALKKADVALVTATSLINGTADDILEAASGCREVVLLGASTPLAPEVFASTSVSWLSGVFVRDKETVLEVVSEGGGMSRFKGHVDKFNLCI